MDLYSLHADPGELEYFDKRLHNKSYIEIIFKVFTDKIGVWEIMDMSDEQLSDTIWNYIDELEKNNKGIIKAIRRMLPDKLEYIEQEFDL